MSRKSSTRRSPALAGVGYLAVRLRPETRKCRLKAPERLSEAMVGLLTVRLRPETSQYNGLKMLLITVIKAVLLKWT